MHVDTDALVGGKLFITNSDNGQIIYTIKDTDTEPTTEFNSCRFLQTKALTELGVAVKPYGVITVSTAALAYITAGADPSKFHVTVQFGDAFYWIDLASLMAMDTGDSVSFSERPAEYTDGEPLPGTGGGGGGATAGGILVPLTQVEGNYSAPYTNGELTDLAMAGNILIFCLDEGYDLGNAKHYILCNNVECYKNGPSYFYVGSSTFTSEDKDSNIFYMPD